MAILNENPPLKTITKQKKWIENGRKPHFEFKFENSTNTNFLEQKQKTMTKHTLNLFFTCFTNSPRPHELWNAFIELQRLLQPLRIFVQVSQRVLDKLGFLKEDTVRKYSFNQGEARDMVMYSILPTDFMPTTFPFPTFTFIFRATLLNFHNLFVYYFVLLPISYNHIYLREIMN